MFHLSNRVWLVVVKQLSTTMWICNIKPTGKRPIAESSGCHFRNGLWTHNRNLKKTIIIFILIILHMLRQPYCRDMLKNVTSLDSYFSCKRKMDIPKFWLWIHKSFVKWDHFNIMALIMYTLLEVFRVSVMSHSRRLLYNIHCLSDLE